MIGKSLLHYEIKDTIGKGGMGEVFRARDTKLGRDVALKILPAELSGDPEREARFQREARALASLQHPNVASVYGFEEVDGVRFLVMELVSGAELTERMNKGPIPVDETLNIARQIAAGLEAAHENGIVHRDLKPANIMETDEGEVKILDFGLAQAWFGDDGTQQESATSPTITAAMTQVGAILGTAAYMSPEQARGSSVDRRADIWAFGVILFEMLTGEAALPGRDSQRHPGGGPARRARLGLPCPSRRRPALCRLIERCLERNPKQRLRDIGEARIFLQDGGASGTNLSFSQTGPGRRRTPSTRRQDRRCCCWRRLALAGPGGAARSWAGRSWRSPNPRRSLHTMIPPPHETGLRPQGTAPGPAAISPDGTKVAFTAVDDEERPCFTCGTWTRASRSACPAPRAPPIRSGRPTASSSGSSNPADEKLRKVAVAGGPPVTLCAAANGKGGSWNEPGDIIFAPDSTRRASTGCPTSAANPCRSPPSAGTRFPSPPPLPARRAGIPLHRARPSDRRDQQQHLPRVAGHDRHAPDHQRVPGQRRLRPGAPADGARRRPDGDALHAGPGARSPRAERRWSRTSCPSRGPAVAVFSPSPSGMLVFQTGASTRAGPDARGRTLENGEHEPLGEPGQIFHPVDLARRPRAVVEVRNAPTKGRICGWLTWTNGSAHAVHLRPRGRELRLSGRPTASTIYLQVGGTRHLPDHAAAGRRAGRRRHPARVGTGRRSRERESRRPDPVCMDSEREDGNFELRVCP